MAKLMNENTKLIGSGKANNRQTYFIAGQKVNLSGLWVRIPNGYEVVAENITGNLRVKKPGLRFFYPWDKKYIYYVKDIPVDFMKEKFKSKEDFEISVDAAVTYNVVDAIRFHVEKNGIQQLNLVIGNILKSYASEHTFEEVNAWAVDIDLEEVIKTRKPAKDIDVNYVMELLDLYGKYGISVSKIIVQKAELSNDLKRSKEEDMLTNARNKRMLATADAELQAAKFKAEAEMAKGEAESVVIAQRIEYINQQIEQCNPEQLKLIKAVLIGDTANYTVIENGIGDNDYSKMAYFKNGNPLFDMKTNEKEQNPQKVLKGDAK